MDICINYKQTYKLQTLSAPHQNRETESFSCASTTSILHINGNLGRESMDAQRTKGCRLKYVRMGHKSTIMFFLSQVLLLKCFQVAQYIAPEWEVKDQVKAFPGIWKAKSQVIHCLMRENSKYLFFEYISRCTWVIMEQSACTHGK